MLDISLLGIESQASDKSRKPMGIFWFAIQLHKLSCSWIPGHDSSNADHKA